MEFEIDKTISYWLESAEYDLETAHSLFQIGSYPYALFFGHLALEKLLKSLFVKNIKEHAPHTHSLPLLANKLGFPDKITDKLAGFMEFYFEARYPDEQRSFYEKCSKSFTEENLDEISKVFKWLKERL